MLLKLHGCITKTSNVYCPLILTPDQYILYRAGRSRLFDHLRDLAIECPLVFVGHSLEDSDIRTLLLDLTQNVDSRPRYYAVLPSFEDIDQRLWEAKKVTLLRGTFWDFLSTLDAGLPPHASRRLARLLPAAELPIVRHFKIPASGLSATALQFLNTDVDYAGHVPPSAPVPPRDFYRGATHQWAPIEQGLDIRRLLGDTLLSDHFLIPESAHHGNPEVILIKAHAGAGKTVLLRRLAWDAARDYEALCLFLRPHGAISTAALQELISCTDKRIYFFVDEAATRVRELETLFSDIGPEGSRLTVLLCERINEWNTSAQDLSPYVSTSYELGYLTLKEIDSLLALLEQHGALGTLAGALPHERREAFAERAGRQLLVALHEATLGRPFEDIIHDEYVNITPLEAQRIYLTICVFNRLGVPVRAGLVARLHNVPFEAFRDRFFAPLEQVVYADLDPVIRDYVYRTRHPHIAEIVFHRVLRQQEDRYDLYIRCLKALNVDYSADNRAFRQMVRGRAVLELFPNHELGRGVYQAAIDQMGGSNPHLLHQMALYEMNRPNGSLERAADLLSQASSLAPWDPAIKHSVAELRLKSAETARTPLEREKLLREAIEISLGLKARRTNHTFGHHTLVKIGLRRLTDLLGRGDPAALDADIEAVVKDIERNLSDGLQRFPGDSYLLDAEAQLAQALENSERMVTALRRAIAANPRNSFAAVRLAAYHSNRRELSEAQQVLRTAIDAHPGDRRLHFAYARVLLAGDAPSGDELAYHLQRSFTPGDSNYDAQLLYGRQLFINGERDASRGIFRTLSEARVDPDYKDALLYPLQERFRGAVIKIEASYCFLVRDGLGDWIFAHRKSIERSLWMVLTTGMRLTFRIAFTLRGQNAFDVRREE
jgi:cytochrome c-type biogenesis protein CcmH/NrfG